MPIDFRCPHCQRGIRAPDQAAGQTMRCPGCNNGAPVPLPGGMPGGMNPYAGPQQAPGPTGPLPKMPLKRRLIKVGEIYSLAGSLFMQHGGMLFVASLIVVAMNILATVLVTGLVFAIYWALAMSFIVHLSVTAIVIFALALLPMVLLLEVAAASYMSYGYVRTCLNFCRGYGRISDVFMAGKSYLAGFLFVYIFLIGTYALIAAVYGATVAAIWFAVEVTQMIDRTYLPFAIIAGFWAAGLATTVIMNLGPLYFGLTPYFIVDRQMNLTDAARHSLEYMQGNKATVFLITLVFNLVNLGVSIVGSCGGPLIALPIGMLTWIFTFSVVAFLWTVVYLRVTNQVTTADPPPSSRPGGAPMY